MRVRMLAAAGRSKRLAGILGRPGIALSRRPPRQFAVQLAFDAGQRRVPPRLSGFD